MVLTLRHVVLRWVKIFQGSLNGQVARLALRGCGLKISALPAGFALVSATPREILRLGNVGAPTRRSGPNFGLLNRTRRNEVKRAEGPTGFLRPSSLDHCDCEALLLIIRRGRRE